MVNDDIERLIRETSAALRTRPDYASRLAGLAETVMAQGHRQRAAGLAREAMALGRDDPATMMRGRRLLSSLLPGYHVARGLP